MKQLLITIAAVAFAGGVAKSQTVDCSLFWKKDSVQIAHCVSQGGVEYKTIGHHGPAVENSHMILRHYFNDSGAIDVYSKSRPGQLELRKYYWYPSEAQIEAGAGCDEYRVGKTVGLGGIALWDGEKEVKLKATAGREVWVEKKGKAALAKMLHKGVEYKGQKVDILVTMEVKEKSRWATVTAECVSGQVVQFLTGVNKHPGQTVQVDMARRKGAISVWGVHPGDVVKKPLPIGGGMVFGTKVWTSNAQTDDMVRLISKPCKKACTQVIAACQREQELNTPQTFRAHVAKVAGAKIDAPKSQRTF